MYVIIDRIEHDTFYDLAYIRVGSIEHQGIVLTLPVPQGLNDEWLDKLLTEELNKLVDYLKIQAAQLYESNA